MGTERFVRYKSKAFTDEEVAVLADILWHRRDVRGNRFVPNKNIEQEKLDQIIKAGMCAPSVGFSQPWEFVLIKDKNIRKKIKSSFGVENQKAKPLFSGSQQETYNQLKLEGILQSDLNIAVFYKPSETPVLGQTAMPEMGIYSVVCAIQNMWLMARALQIGMGWVSILDPEKVKTILNAPPNRSLVGYLCLGYTDFFYSKPELELKKWNRKKQQEEVVFYESFDTKNK